MPHLLPKSLRDSRQVVIVQAFGALSYLEALMVMSGELEGAELLCEDIALLNLKDERSRRYERLAGMHKAAIPVRMRTEDEPAESIRVDRASLDALEDGFNFSVSLYCHGEGDWEEEHERLCGEVLSTIRSLGFRKANLVRPRDGPELRGAEVLTRRCLDFVVFPGGRDRRFALTAYVPDLAEFDRRSRERPVVGAKISLSSRLAKVLVNMSGVTRGEFILDPFCGTGAILGEAVISGINCIGVDRNPGRVENARKNLVWFSSSNVGAGTHTIILGESSNLGALLGGRLVDAVVTEPIFLPRMTFTPSLKKAKKLIRNASRLYSEAIYSMAEVVRRGGRIVIVTPSLRTKEGKYVSVLLENIAEAKLRLFHPEGQTFMYPVRVAHESTRWIRRHVYVFERC